MHLERQARRAGAVLAVFSFLFMIPCEINGVYNDKDAWGRLSGHLGSFGWRTIPLLEASVRAYMSLAGASCTSNDATYIL